MHSLVGLPDEILARVAHCAVNGEMETAHGDALRRRTGLAIALTCKRLHTFGTIALYRRIRLASHSAVRRLTDQLALSTAGPLSLLVSVADIRFIALAFPPLHSLADKMDVGARIVRLLSYTSRLEGFVNLGVWLGGLWPDMFEALVAHTWRTLRHLTGFSLDSETFAGPYDIVEKLARLPKLEEVATIQFWTTHSVLPAASSAVMPRLRSLEAAFYTPLGSVAEPGTDSLPSLVAITARSWKFDIIRTMLETHGVRILRLDLDYEFRQLVHEPNHAKKTQLIRLCPNLRHLACHSVGGLSALLMHGHASLLTVHLSAPHFAGSSRKPQRTSFALLPACIAEVTELLAQKNWERRLPQMKFMTIYAQASRAIEDWVAMLHRRGIELVVI